jgi:hypothetical protein
VSSALRTSGSPTRLEEHARGTPGSHRVDTRGARLIESILEELASSSIEDVAARYMSADLRMEQEGFPVRDRDGWIASQRMFESSFPDMTEWFEFEGAEGDVVRGASCARGTHTGDLDLTAAGIGVLKATGKVVESRNEVEFTVQDDKVVRMVARPGSGGGIEGVLEQLGVEIPGAATPVRQTPLSNVAMNTSRAPRSRLPAHRLALWTGPS